jgi:hypothetical protein
MEELERARTEREAAGTKHPELEAELESLRLARAELDRQLASSAHERRRAQLTDAIAELDRRAAAVRAKIEGI